MEESKRIDELSNSNLLRPCNRSSNLNPPPISLKRIDESNNNLLKPCYRSSSSSIKPPTSSKKKKKRGESNLLLKHVQLFRFRCTIRRKKNNHTRRRSRVSHHYCDILDAEKIGRKVLYRFDDGQMVGIEETLKGKSVAILFSVKRMASSSDYSTDHYYSVLQQVYKQIREKHGNVLELVYVACPDDQDDNHALSFLQPRPLSWLAVPFHDLEWRRRIFKKYRNPDNGFDFINQLMLFDPQGRRIKGVRHSIMLDALTNTYGPTFYPFTAAWERKLIKEGNAIGLSNSLEVILSGGDNAGFVVQNDGKTKVPVSQLVQDNVAVGLLFYKRGVTQSCMEQVVSMYKQVNKRGRKFEIIFVNVSYRLGYTDETSFLNALKDFPHWLALPFNDERVWRLHATLTHSWVYGLELAIIGPSRNPFVELHALPIFQEYGIQAYPFSLNDAVHAEMERLKKKKLADYFKGWGLSSLRCKNGEHVKVSSFLQEDHGKGVLLYIASHGNYVNPPSPCKENQLFELYNDNNHTLSSFKVVFLSLEYDNEDAFIHDTMPSSWLAISCKSLPAETMHGDESMYGDDRVIIWRQPHILAFDGTTGCFLKMGALESLGVDEDFPYITHQDFFDFLKSWLANVHCWYRTPGYF